MEAFVPLLVTATPSPAPQLSLLGQLGLCWSFIALSTQRSQPSPHVAAAFAAYCFLFIAFLNDSISLFLIFIRLCF